MDKHRKFSFVFSQAFWRWECNTSSQLCERIPVKQIDDRGESLKTCRMTCGPVPIWPLPTSEVTMSKRSVTFNRNQLIIEEIKAVNKQVHHMLQLATDIFLSDINSRQRKASSIVPDVNQVQIFINVFGNSSDVKPYLHIDESYKIVITQKDYNVLIYIRSGSFFGARHGLETLGQLIWFDESIGLLRILNEGKIVDIPAFTYRGLLLDTSHHYIPVPSIKRTLVAMSISKMNMFHWYMMSPQSFPFYYDAKANQAVHGAFSDEEVYTKVDVRDIVEFAAIRGILVHIEIENPAHSERNTSSEFTSGTNSMKCFGNQISTLKFCEKSSNCKQTIPEREFFYKVVKEIFAELEYAEGKLKFQHFGGRNIDQRCLKNSIDSTASDVYRNKGFYGVLQYFQNSYYDILRKKSIKNNLPDVILWSEFFRNFKDPTRVLSSKTYIAQINGDSDWDEATSLINSGYRVIISNMDKWALNRLPIWRIVYEHRPWQEFSWSQRQQVLGGEASLWSEFVDDNTLDTRIWPNAAVVGEVLWSDPQTDSTEASVRLEVFREYLLERGIQASAISPRWCYLNPGMCL